MLISLTLAFMTLFCQINNKLEYNYAVLPFCFSFLLIIFNKLFQTLILKNPGLTTIIFISFMRYVILPYLMSDSGALSIYLHDNSFLNNGILLMIYEMICIFIGIFLFYYKVRFIKTSSFKISKRLWNKRKLIVLISVIAIVILFFTNRSLIGGFSLITKGAVEDSGIITEKSSFAKILWTILTTWLYVFGVLVASANYNHSKKQKYIIYSVIYTLLFILITYISQDRISRWYTLMCALGGIYLLIHCFSDKKRLITLYIVVPVSILMISATLFKNFAESILTGNNEETMLISTMDAYLAGPCSVSNSIALNDKYKDIGFNSLAYDLVNNMPVVNHYFDTDKSTVYLYNQFLGRIFTIDGRGDQIIPLIGQGYTYFGYLFAPLLSILCLYFLSYFDSKYTKSSGYYTYLYAFIACWIAVAPVLNLTLILSWIYIRLIPLFVFFSIVKRF